MQIPSRFFGVKRLLPDHLWIYRRFIILLLNQPCAITESHNVRSGICHVSVMNEAAHLTHYAWGLVMKGNKTQKKQ